MGLECPPKYAKAFRDVAQFHKIEWHETTSVANQADVVLVFGGDGTVHRHLRELVELGAPVLVVAVGSGNDFARALGLRHVRDSLAAWRRFCAGHGTVRAIDLGVITPLQVSSLSEACDASRAIGNCGHYFCSVAGVGLDSEVARRAAGLPRWLRAHGGYALSLFPAIFRFTPLPVRILSDGETGWNTRSDQPTILAAFANSASYGGGMKIAPQARMDDGQLEVCVIGGIDRFKLACLFPTVYFGRHTRIREVSYFQSSRLRIEAETPLDVYADGEYVCRTPVEIAVGRHLLPVVVHPSQTGS